MTKKTSVSYFQNGFLDLIYLILYLVIILILVPIYILSSVWKCLVFGIVKIFYSQSLRPTFGFWEYFFMRNDPNYLSQPNKTFYILATLEGKELNVQQLKENMTKKILDVKNPDGSFTYERLRQYPKRFGGYWVFELCQNFHIDKHVRVTLENINKNNLGQFLAKLSDVPFQADTPPWDIVIIPNFNNENKTLLYWRIHHVLSDGLSIVRLMMSRAFIGGNLEQDLARITQYKVPATPLKKLSMKSLYMKTIGWPRYFGEKTFSGSSKVLCLGAQSSQSFVCSTNKIPLEYFKQLKKEHNRSMTVVLMAAISFALQTYCQKQFKSQSSDIINVMTLLPLTQSPDDESLINNFGITGVKIPINDTSSTGTTVYSMMDYISTESDKFNETLGSPLELLLQKLMSPFPRNVMKLFSPKIGGVILSNVMGPSQSTTTFGIPVEELQFWIKSASYLPITFNVISYNGYIRVDLMGSSSVVPNEETLKKLCENIETILMNLFKKSNWDINYV